MRIFLVFLLLLTAACAPQYVESISTGPQDLPARKALFAENPSDLHQAFTDACDAPGDVLATPAKGITQCRTLPTADFAAFLLVQYDGALEAPVVVMQKQQTFTGASPTQALIEISYFAEVPQKTGASRRIYYKDRVLDRVLDKMLQAAGGETVRE